MDQDQALRLQLWSVGVRPILETLHDPTENLKLPAELVPAGAQAQHGAKLKLPGVSCLSAIPNRNGGCPPRGSWRFCTCWQPHDLSKSLVFAKRRRAFSVTGLAWNRLLLCRDPKGSLWEVSTGGGVCRGKGETLRVGEWAPF